MSQLTPEQLAELLRRLDEVCSQAQELSKQVKEQMSTRRRADQPIFDGPFVERRRTTSGGHARERRSGTDRRRHPATD